MQHVLILLSLYYVVSVHSSTCYTSTNIQGYSNWFPGRLIGQTFFGVPESGWTGSSFRRYDTNAVNGTFYIVPGNSTNISIAVYSQPFSFGNTNYVYTNGSFYLTPGANYTFLWMNEGALASTFWSTSESSEYIPGGKIQPATNGSYYFDPITDMTGQFCFDSLVPPSPSVSPTPSVTPSVSTYPTSSVSPTPSATSSSVSPPVPSSTPSSSLPIPSGTPMSTPSASSDAQKSSEDGLDSGSIIAIAVAIPVAAIALIGVAVYAAKRKPAAPNTVEMVTND